MKQFSVLLLAWGVALVWPASLAHGQLGGGGSLHLDVVIAHVQPRSLDEVVAVENKNPFPLNLSGWSLEAGTLSNRNQQHFTFPEGCALPPGATVRIHAGPAVWFRAALDCGQMVFDLNWRGWFTLDDRAGVVTLKDAGGKVIATYQYPDAITPMVVINEVELNPAGPDRGHEWVELYNPSAQAIDVNDWSVGATQGTSVKLSIPLEGTIAPGGFKLVQVSVEFLNNAIEGVELRAPDGTLVDRTPEAGFVDLLDDDRCWARVTDAGAGWTFQPCSPQAGNAQAP